MPDGTGLWPRRLAVTALVGGVVLYLAVFGPRYGLDLRVYRDSVSTWWSGRNPYQATFTIHALPFTYPPFALPVLSPLTWVPFRWSQWIFWIVSIGAGSATVVIIRGGRASLRSRHDWLPALGWACAAVLILEPMRSAIDYGQIEVVLMFVIVADLLVVPAPVRGILLGLAAAIKLTPLVFLLVLVVRGDWKSTIRASGAFVGATAAMWLVDPSMSHIFWTQDVNAPGRTGPIAYPSNLSWYAISHRWPFLASGSPVAWAVLSVITLGVGAFLAWRCSNTHRPSWTIIVVALTGLLVSPISWSHHWVWLLLIPPLLVGTDAADVPASVRRMLWVLVVLAVAAPYWWLKTGVDASLLQAIVPLWAGATIATWAIIEFSAMRKAHALESGGPLSRVRSTAPYHH
jgi:alpha-1,2-mannosyltransferase